MVIPNHLKAGVDVTPGPALLVASDGTIVLTNPRLDALFGYSAGELTGQQIEVLVPEAIRGAHPELRDAFFAVPCAREVGTGRDLFGVRKDGTQVPVEVGLVPVESEDSLWVMVSVLDITERRRQEQMIRNALDAAASSMIMVDRNGFIVMTNDEACRTFGYSSTQMIGQKLEMLVPERMRRRHNVYRTSYSMDPQRRQMGSGRDLTGRRSDGSEFPVEIGLTPIESHGDRFIMSTIIDISERKASERQIKHQNDDLSRLNEELSQFAYSASHDLKAPLTSVQGLLRYVQSDLERGNIPEVHANLERMESLVARLAGRIEDVLNLAQSSHLECELTTVNLNEELDRVCEELATQISAKGIAIIRDLEVSEFDTERIRLSQILDNLISNAVKYCDLDNPDRFVRVASTVEAGELTLQIEDNGLGIPEENHPDVFKVFRRFRSHPETGNGLGLALVKKHVSCLGGSIVFDAPSKGARFTLVLPMGEEKSEC